MSYECPVCLNAAARPVHLVCADYIENVMEGSKREGRAEALREVLEIADDTVGPTANPALHRVCNRIRALLGKECD